MASMMPFLGAAAGNAMQAYDQSNYRNKMMDLQKSRLDQSSRLDERRMDLTEQELTARKDQAKRQETMDFLKTFATMAEMSDDASLPAIVEQFNAIAPSVNPNLSKLSGFRRKGKGQYEFMTDADGKKWLANVGSGGELDIKPLTLPGGQQFTEKVDPAKPIEVGDDRALIRPGETQPYYKGPKFGVDKVGSDKIGSTKESLIAKKARGEEWDEHEQAAWDLMDEREKQIANETMGMLAKNPDFIEMKPQEQEVAAKKILGTFRSVFGRKKGEGGDKTKKVIRTGTDPSGRRINLYEDGTSGYAD